MGQYFYFHNITKNNEISKAPCSYNFGLAWAKDLHKDHLWSFDDMQAIFKDVIERNPGWEDSDNIVAKGDYGDEVPYSDYRLS